jgi:hypothetical protein
VLDVLIAGAVLVLVVLWIAGRWTGPISNRRRRAEAPAKIVPEEARGSGGLTSDGGGPSETSDARPSAIAGREGLDGNSGGGDAVAEAVLPDRPQSVRAEIHDESGVTRTRPGSHGVQAPLPPDDDPPMSIVHDVPPDVSEFIIPDFRPGIDLCRVRLACPDIDFVHWRGRTSVTLEFHDGRERLRVVFYGQGRPPLEDVEVVFDHPRRGEERYLLAELVGAAETALPGGVAVEPYSSGSEGALTEFAAFDASAEFIEILVPPNGAAAPRAIEVHPTLDGRDALVLIDGAPTAVLRGAPEATMRNVRLVTADAEVAA